MNEKDLIKNIKSGNEDAFKEFISRYQKLVLNTCYGFLNDKTDAEDVTQEVFISVFLSADKFNENSKISTWLYRIAVNKSLNYIRDNKKRNIFRSIESFFGNDKNDELQIADSSDYDSDSSETDDERRKILQTAIDSLSQRQKTAFILNKYENLSYKQISEVMNLSLPSVEGLIHRAKINVQKKVLRFYKGKQKF